METKNLTCIVCPLGCAMTAQIDGGKIVSISGHTCKRGESYARTELSDPRRTLTTTMRVKGNGLVSVKSKDPLPKGKLFDCMTVINAWEAQAPVEIGDVLIKDIMGLGVDIVATSRVKGV
jgi:CxxC motif-containing protein